MGPHDQFYCPFNKVKIPNADFGYSPQKIVLVSNFIIFDTLSQKFLIGKVN
jgi:hypothetical protein